MKPQLQAWSGLPIGLLAWYGAHEIGFYMLASDCAARGWLVLTMHVIALSIALTGAALSAATLKSNGDAKFGAIVGLGTGLLFAFVILWQGVATLIYSGCER
jgi:hypothetical protein